MVAVRVHLDLGARTGLRCVGRQRRLRVERTERALCRVVGKGRDGASGLVADIEKLSAFSEGEMTRRRSELRCLDRWRRVRRQGAGSSVEAVYHDLVEALLRDEEELAVRRQQHAVGV